MAECKASTMLDEITPEERQRRLGQVYGLLISLARQKRDVEQQPPSEPALTAIGDVPVAGG
jgi:hypothetical protein